MAFNATKIIFQIAGGLDICHLNSLYYFLGHQAASLSLNVHSVDKVFLGGLFKKCIFSLGGFLK